MSKWMILGASPCAPQYYQVPDVDVVASAGSSIKLDIVPDYYFIMEKAGLDRYPDERAALREKGMKVVLCKQAAEQFLGGKRRTYPRDLIIDVPGEFYDAWRTWEPGRFCKSTSGAIATQFAVNHGAREVHLVGLEGYTGNSKKGGEDYWDCARLSAPASYRWSMEAFGPMIQRIADKCPHVQFITYGKLVFPFKGDNVTAYADDS